MAEVRQRQLELGEQTGIAVSVFRTYIGGGAAGRSERFSEPATQFLLE
jgi:hypothetical protein